MRTICAAVMLLLSTQVVSASEERSAFWRHVRPFGPDVSLPAYEYLECTEAAAKDAAHRDSATPRDWMADWAATEAAKQCEAEGAALLAAAGKAQADAIKAIVHRANVAAALSVRRRDPLMVCALAWRSLCSM